MDFNIIWKSIVIFNFFFNVIWVCIYTFRGNFMNDDDFVDPQTGQRGARNAASNNDSFFSMAGRSLVFLIAIISAIIASMIFFIYYNYYVKATLKCKKGKGLKDCKLIK
jgi:hypothetical protein